MSNENEFKYQPIPEDTGIDIEKEIEEKPMPSPKEIRAEIEKEYEEEPLIVLSEKQKKFIEIAKTKPRKELTKKELDEKRKSSEKIKKILLIATPLAAMIFGKPLRQESGIVNEKKPILPSKPPHKIIYKEDISIESAMEKLRIKQIQNMMESDVGNIYNGKSFQGELKGKYFTLKDLEKLEVNKDLLDEAEAYVNIVRYADDAKTKEKYIRDIIKHYYELYDHGLKEDFSKKELEQLSAVYLATVHEWNNIEHDKIIEDVSREYAPFEKVSQWIEIGDKIVDIDPQKDKFFVEIGKGKVELTKPIYSGDKITNLKSLKEIDPDTYKNILENNADEYAQQIINELVRQGCHIEKDDKLALSLIKEQIIESVNQKGDEIQIDLPHLELKKDQEKINLNQLRINGKEYRLRFGMYETFKIGDNIFSVPGAEISSLVNYENGVKVSFDLEVLKGQTNAKVFCTGDEVRVIIPETKMEVTQYSYEQKKVATILALTLFLPLLVLKKKRKDKKEKNK